MGSPSPLPDFCDCTPKLPHRQCGRAAVADPNKSSAPALQVVGNLETAKSIRVDRKMQGQLPGGCASQGYDWQWIVQVGVPETRRLLRISLAWRSSHARSGCHSGCRNSRGNRALLSLPMNRPPPYRQSSSESDGHCSESNSSCSGSGRHVGCGSRGSRGSKRAAHGKQGGQRADSMQHPERDLSSLTQSASNLSAQVICHECHSWTIMLPRARLERHSPHQHGLCEVSTSVCSAHSHAEELRAGLGSADVAQSRGEPPQQICA